jgi:hypothetical protein
MTNEAKMATNPASPELTDDELALVVGGDKSVGPNALADQQRAAQDKAFADASRTFGQMLQGL